VVCAALCSVLLAACLFGGPVEAKNKNSRSISEHVTANAVTIMSWEKSGGKGPAPTPKPKPKPKHKKDCEGDCNDDGDNNDNGNYDDSQNWPDYCDGCTMPGNATNNNPNNDKQQSTLRITLVVDDNEIYMTYRYYSFLFDPDTQSKDSNKFKYMLRLGKLIEYQDNNGIDGFQPSGDKLVQTWSFANADPFTNWQRTIDSNTGAHVYTISNGVFTFAARISANTFMMGNDQIYPDDLKFDIFINNFPYQTNGESYLALVGWVQSKLDIAVSEGSNNKLALGGSDAAITWVTNCDLDDHTDCNVVLGAAYDDPDSCKDDSFDHESSNGDNVKATIWSFVDDGGHPDSISWDPKLQNGVDDEVTDSASGVAVCAAALAACVAAAVAF
jgi:hypothetical protein